MLLCLQKSLLLSDSSNILFRIFPLCMRSKPVQAQKKLVHERQFARAASSARAIALDYLELYVQSKIFVCEMLSFLLLKKFKCLI